jgi:hypothetical protein
MVEHRGDLLTSWHPFSSSGGDGGHRHWLAYSLNSIHSIGLATTARVNDAKWYNVYLLVWSIFLVAWATPSHGRMQPETANTAAAALTDRASAVELQSCDRGAGDHSDRPRMKRNERPRKRRARQRNEDLTKPGECLVACWPEAASATLPQANGSPHAGLGNVGPFRSTRSAVLRC